MSHTPLAATFYSNLKLSFRRDSCCMNLISIQLQRHRISNSIKSHFSLTARLLLTVISCVRAQPTSRRLCTSALAPRKPASQPASQPTWCFIMPQQLTATFRHRRLLCIVLHIIMLHNKNSRHNANISSKTERRSSRMNESKK